MKKKVILIGLILILTSSIFSIGAFAKEDEKKIKKTSNLELTTNEVQNLLSLGFNENEINNMDAEEFNLNKDLKGKVVGTSTKYVKTIETLPDLETKSLELQSNDSEAKSVDQGISIELDEETYFEELDSLDNQEQFPTLSETIPTSYKRMTTTVTKLATDRYRLKNSVTWDRIPTYRYVDVSGVGINLTYWGPDANTEYGKQNWTTWSYCNGTQSDSATYTTSSTKWKRGSGGYSLKMNLPNDESTGGCAADKVKTLSSYMYFNVSELTNTTRLDAYGQYAHQEANYTLTPSISLSGISFDVSPSTKFSFHPNTHVQQSN
jgi:hypothetical protein